VLAVSHARGSLHRTLQDHNCLIVDLPSLTSSDCEGAGEAFQVIHPGSKNPATSFFGAPMFLTVSRQLHLEAAACAYSRVYTLGPTFRAENSNTTRHLAEFQMLEVELAFTKSLDDILTVADDCVRNAAADVLSKCGPELDQLVRWSDKAAKLRIERLVSESAVHMSHADAVAALLASGREFSHKPDAHSALGSDMERFLCEEYTAGRRVFVRDYPRRVKAFYARANDDPLDTVAASDMLIPGVGEVMGGTLREERLDRLEAAMAAALGPEAIHHPSYNWYVDLRRFGSVPHGGFGIGVDRLVQFLCSLGNIRDATAFPRFPQSAAY
jgi:asparaginyl-tRNA synthetase